MKSFIALLVLVGSQVVSAAEFQLFVDYDSTTHKYSQKLFSTSEAPLSADAFMSGYAVCYKGDVQEVNALFESMVAVKNSEGGPLVTGELDWLVKEDSKAYASIVLTKTFRSHGRSYTQIYTYPQIRPCIR